MRILLIEDDDILRRTTSLLLSKWSDGGVVDVAEDGVTALDMMRTCSYDLVFLDNQLPGISGQDVAFRIRKELLQKHPWLVGLSGHVAEAERVAFMESGMNDVFQKPLSKDKFQLIASRMPH